jgi:hypothetical protein
MTKRLSSTRPISYAELSNSDSDADDISVWEEKKSVPESKKNRKSPSKPKSKKDLESDDDDISVWEEEKPVPESKKNRKTPVKPKSKKEFEKSKLIPDSDTVLKIVRNLPRRKKKNESEVIKAMEGVLEVEDLSSKEVVLKIEDLVISIVSQILKGNSFELNVPNRNNSNQIYVEEIDRNVLGNKISKREFLSVAQVRKVAITTRVTELVHEVLTKGIHVTKRDLFCNN